MPPGILDGQAEVAASLVQVKRAGLKDRLVLASIEIPEADEVIQQLKEVAVVAGEVCHRGDGSKLRLQALVLCDKLGEGILGRADQNLAHTVPPKLRHRAPGLARRPALVGPEFRQQLAPFRLGQHTLLAEKWIDRVAA